MKGFYFILMGDREPIVTLVRATNSETAWKRYIDKECQETLAEHEGSYSRTKEYLRDSGLYIIDQDGIDII